MGRTTALGRIMSARLNERPSRFLLRQDCVIIPPRIASNLVRYLDLQAIAVQSAADVEFVEALAALHTASTEWRSSLRGTPVERTAEQPTRSEEVVVATEAARLLGIGPRAVGMARQRGRLPGRRVAGRWVYDRLDIENYRAEVRERRSR